MIRARTERIRLLTMEIDELADQPPPAPAELPRIYAAPDVTEKELFDWYLNTWKPGQGGGATPDPTPPIPPSPPPASPPGRLDARPLLFSEARPPALHGIPSAAVMSLSRHQALGQFPIACWHPWYAPEHGTRDWPRPDSAQAKVFAASGEEKIYDWLKADIDLAVRNGYRGWGVDWEGGLNQKRLVNTLATLSSYARSRGLAVIHVPKSNMAHQIPSMFPTRGRMVDWCCHNTDGIALWGWGLDTQSWDAYTGALWGLLWPRGDGGRGDGRAKVSWAASHGRGARVWSGLNNPGQLGPEPQPEVILAVRKAWT